MLARSQAATERRYGRRMDLKNTGHIRQLSLVRIQPRDVSKVTSSFAI